MKKKAFALALALCLCLTVSAGAFASGDPGGGPGGPGGPPGGNAATYEYTVSAAGVETAAETGATLSVPFDASGISGFEAEGNGNGLVSVLGDDTTEGAVSLVLGGSGEMYDAGTLDIYPAAQAKLGFKAFDSVADMGSAPLAAARGGAYLELDGVYAAGQTGLLNAGSDSDRYSGTDDSAYIDTVVVVRNSYLESESSTPINEDRWPHGTTLMVRGANRTALSVGESETYYYGSAVVVDGWAAMATDSAVGMGLDMVAYNSYAATRLGGYCSYSDSRCRDFLYGTTYESAEYGSIIANFGELYILGTDEAAADTNTIRAASGGTELASRAAVDPLAFANPDDILTENVPSDVAGFRNAVMMHVPDIMGGGAKISDAKGILYVKGSTIATREDLAPADYATGEYTEAWIANVGEANYAYLEYTRGAAVLIRSDNALVHLTDANVESYTGVLIQSALNADANGNWIPADAEVSDRIGIDVIVDGTTALVGNINHEDYHRVMNITLADDASLTGDIFTGTADTWHARFADYLDSGANFIRDLDGYDTVRGTNVTLQDNAVWTVTEGSSITGLTIEPGAVLNGTVTVDGETVDVSAGGSWTGEIVILPDASGAGSDSPAVGMANPWTDGTVEDVEKATGFSLVVPEDTEVTARYMAGMAEASWNWDGVEVTERISRSDEAPAMGTETLTALSGVYFTGMSTQSKELVVGGRCPGYMEFCRGSLGAILWYDEEAGLVYTVSFDKTADPKNLGDTAEWITPLQSDAEENSMIVIDGCAIAHDLSTVPVNGIADPSDYLWKIVSGYGITYTDGSGVVWGIYRAGQAGEFEIVVSSEDSPSPWTVEDQIWVGGSKIVELCVENGRLTYILTDELVSGPAYDVEIW